MRTSMWCLAVCGVVGLTWGIGNAKDELPDKYRSSMNPTRFMGPTFDFFSRSGTNKDTANQNGKLDRASKKAVPDATRLAKTSLKIGPATTRDVSVSRKMNSFDSFNAEKKSPSRYLSRRTPNVRYLRTRSQADTDKAPVKNDYAQLFTAGDQSNANDRSVELDSDPAPSTANKAIYRLDAPQKKSPQQLQLAKASSSRRPSKQQEDIGLTGPTEDNDSPFHKMGESSEAKFGWLALERHSKPTSADQTTQEIRLVNAIEPSLDPHPSIASAESLKGSPTSISLQWIKNRNNSDIHVGREYQCDLIVKNTGKLAAKNVVVDAYFPTTVKLTSVIPEPTEADQNLSWLFDSLAPGEVHSIKINLIPSQRGDLKTSAQVRFSGTATGLFQVHEPLLAITVEGPSTVIVGDPVSQIITIANSGTGVARNVGIQVEISKGLDHPHGQQRMIEIGSLNSGEWSTIRLSMVAVSTGEKDIQIEAHADADISAANITKVNVTAPNLQVIVDGPAVRYLGRRAKYSVAVINNGTAATNKVRVIHKLPDGFEFVKADKGGSFDKSNRAVNWFVGALKPGESTRLYSQLTTTDFGEFVHHVSAISEQGGNTTSQLSTRVEGTASLRLEIVDLDDPVEVGRETAYEFRVRNDGSRSAKNVGLSCELPAGIELIRAKGPTDLVSKNGRVIFKPLIELAPGKTTLYHVYIRGVAEGNQRIRARLTSESFQEPLVFEEMTKFYAD